MNSFGFCPICKVQESEQEVCAVCLDRIILNIRQRPFADPRIRQFLEGVIFNNPLALEAINLLNT